MNKTTIIFIVGIIIGSLTVGGVYWYIQSAQSQKKSDQATVQYDKVAIIQAVQKQSRLETVTETVQRNVKISLDLGSFSIFNVPLLENKREQEIAATVRIGAGVDLSKLNEQEVKVTDNNVTINLPKPTIFYAEIVEDKTDLVKDDVTFLFQFQTFINQSQRESLNKYLLQQIIKQSKQATVEVACADNILDKANANAINSVQSLLESSGVKNVKVTSQKSEVCELAE